MSDIQRTTVMAAVIGRYEAKAKSLFSWFSLLDLSGELPGILMLLALFGGGPDQLGHFGHFKPDLLIDDFQKRDVRGTVIAGLDERPAHCARAGIELAHPA